MASDFLSLPISSRLLSRVISTQPKRSEPQSSSFYESLKKRMGIGMDFDLQKNRVKVLLFIVGIIALGITAQKCREMVGEEASSKSGKFTLLNCFDMSTGTLACAVKEAVKQS